MHYFQWNIGDYASHTQRLSLYEDLAYRRLLDLYYLNERPFNECSSDVAREIGMVKQVSEVDYILNKYFTLEGGFWVQNRADKEIEFYQNKQKSASKAGKASGKARKLKASERPLNNSSTTVQPTNNQQPITINQETIKKTMSGKPADHSQIPFTGKTKIQKAEHIVTLLNKRVNKNFRARTPNNKPTSNAQMIMKRIDEGYELKDFAVVVKAQIEKWGKDDKMSEYLRPSTLFAKQNFENYLGGAGELSRM